MTTILLTRHGHVDGIKPKRFRGRENLPLTELGHRQAAADVRLGLLVREHRGERPGRHQQAVEARQQRDLRFPRRWDHHRQPARSADDGVGVARRGGMGRPLSRRRRAGEGLFIG